MLEKREFVAEHRRSYGSTPATPINHATSFGLSSSAAKALGEIGSAEAVPALIQVLNAPRGVYWRAAVPGEEIRVKRILVEALREIGTPEALKAATGYLGIQ